MKDRVGRLGRILRELKEEEAELEEIKMEGGDSWSLVWGAKLALEKAIVQVDKAIGYLREA